MISEIIKIQNKLGLHARAASVFVETAQEFVSTITVASNSATANGKSIMNMMMLQASIDSDIKIEIEGEDEDLAMFALVDLVNQKFGEDG